MKCSGSSRRGTLGNLWVAVPLFLWFGCDALLPIVSAPGSEKDLAPKRDLSPSGDLRMAEPPDMNCLYLVISTPRWDNSSVLGPGSLQGRPQIVAERTDDVKDLAMPDMNMPDLAPATKSLRLATCANAAQNVSLVVYAHSGVQKPVPADKRSTQTTLFFSVSPELNSGDVLILEEGGKYGPGYLIASGELDRNP